MKKTETTGQCELLLKRWFWWKGCCWKGCCWKGLFFAWANFWANECGRNLSFFDWYLPNWSFFWRMTTRRPRSFPRTHYILIQRGKTLIKRLKKCNFGSKNLPWTQAHSHNWKKLGIHAGGSSIWGSQQGLFSRFLIVSSLPCVA